MSARWFAAALVLGAVSCASRGYDRGALPVKPLGKYEQAEITDGGIMAALAAEPVAKAPFKVLVYTDDFENHVRSGYYYRPDTPGYPPGHRRLWADGRDERCPELVKGDDYIPVTCGAFHTVERYGPVDEMILPQEDWPLPSEGDDSEYYSASRIRSLTVMARRADANLLLVVNENFNSKMMMTPLSPFALLNIAILPGLVIPEVRYDLSGEITATLWDVSSEYLYFAEQVQFRFDTGIVPMAYDNDGELARLRQDASETLGRLVGKRFRQLADTGRAR